MAKEGQQETETTAHQVRGIRYPQAIYFDQRDPLAPQTCPWDPPAFTVLGPRCIRQLSLLVVDPRLGRRSTKAICLQSLRVLLIVETHTSRVLPRGFVVSKCYTVCVKTIQNSCTRFAQPTTNVKQTPSTGAKNSPYSGPLSWHGAVSVLT